MAQRHSLATSEAKKKSSSSSSSSSMDPTRKKHHPSLSTTATKTQQQQHPQAPFPSSPLNEPKPHYYYPKPSSTHKPHHQPSSLFSSSDPPHDHIQTQMLTRSLTLSTISDSSFLNKSHHSLSHNTHRNHNHNHHQQQKQSQKPKKIKEEEEEKIKTKKGSKEESKVVVVHQEREREREKEEEEETKRPSVSSLVSVGGRRKSFCGDSKIELKDFFSSVTARIVAVDMAPFMQIHAVSCARKTHDSLEKPSPGILASTLKKEFDGVYGPAWHCIVGSSFGSFVTHSVGGFLYFSIDHKLYFLLFKTTVQKAD